MEQKAPYFCSNILDDFYTIFKSYFKEKYKKEVLGFSLFPTLYDGVFRFQVITEQKIYETLLGENMDFVSKVAEFKELKNGK